MLPKAHLTSHSRIFASRWVITPSWLAESLRSFLYNSLHSLSPLLNISASVRSIPFLYFFVPVFAWNVSLVSLILLKRSLVLPILLFFSISLHCSLRKAFFSLLAILWNSVFRWKYISFSPLSFASLLYSANVKTPQAIILPVCTFFSWGWFWSLPSVQYHYSVHSSSGTLSIRSSPLNLFVASTV